MNDQGMYDVTIKDQGFNEASTGTEQFWLQFDTENYIEGDGSVRPVVEICERTAYLPITAKTAAKVISQLREIGFDGDSFTDLEPGGRCSLIGASTRMRCFHDEWKGNTREKWELPYSGGSGPGQADGIARKLDALFGADLKKTATKQPTQKPPEPVNTGTGEATADDVPF